MSLQQYNSLMSNLLKEKHAFASLRAKIKGKKERECWSCKGFRHLAQNYRKQKEKKRETISQNKFKILSSRVMQSGEGEQYYTTREFSAEM